MSKENLSNSNSERSKKVLIEEIMERMNGLIIEKKDFKEFLEDSDPIALELFGLQPAPVEIPISFAAAFEPIISGFRLPRE